MKNYWKETQYFELNTYIESLTGNLKRQSKAVSGFVNGDEYSLEESIVLKDKLYEEIVKPIDDYFACPVVFCGFHKLISSALKEYLHKRGIQ